MSDAHSRISEIVNANDVVLFMKGTAQFPQCGQPVHLRHFDIRDHYLERSRFLFGQRFPSIRRLFSGLVHHHHVQFF